MTKTAEWAHLSRFGTSSNCLKLNNFDFIASTKSSHIDSATSKQTRSHPNNLVSVWGVGSLQELLTNTTAAVRAEVLVTHTRYTDTGLSKEKLRSDETMRWFVLASDAEAEDVDCTALPLTGTVTTDKEDVCIIQLYPVILVCQIKLKSLLVPPYL